MEFVKGVATGRIGFEHPADELRFGLVDDDGSKPGVVEIADGGLAGKLSPSKLLSHAATHVLGQIIHDMCSCTYRKAFYPIVPSANMPGIDERPDPTGMMDKMWLNGAAVSRSYGYYTLGVMAEPRKSHRFENGHRAYQERLSAVG